MTQPTKFYAILTSGGEPCKITGSAQKTMEHGLCTNADDVAAILAARMLATGSGNGPELGGAA